MIIFQKAIYRYDPTPNKIPVMVFIEIEQKFPKMYMEHKRTQMFNVILSKRIVHQKLPYSNVRLKTLKL